MASTREALEAALAANPDDLAAQRAYADFLAEQPDPHDAARVVFIQVELALQDRSLPGPELLRLDQRSRELLRAHRQAWLQPLKGILSDLEDGDVTFHRGWIDELYAAGLSLAQARQLAVLPELLLLRKLHITDPYDREQGPAPAPQRCYLGNVCVFQVGFEPKYSSYSRDRASLATPFLVAGLPRLEKLFLYAREPNVHTVFALPNLKRLRVLRYERGSFYPLARLAANPALKRLRLLVCRPRPLLHGDEPYINLADLQALVRSPHLQRLTHLSLRMSDFGDAGCAEIVRSGALKRLQVLDLSQGRITDAGARVLAACPDTANLRVLNLRGNELTAAGIALLDAVPNVSVRAERQHDEGDEGYLYEGDWE
jgi:uncharacterized protein (TIGR02996 family)